MNSITTKLVSAADGSVDQDASISAFETELARFVAAREAELGSVAGAVSAVFDQHMGKKIKMPVLSALAASQLNATPENHGVLSELVLDHVRSDAKSASPTYVIAKGPLGGVGRIADLPAPATK
jgi:hypothetical protein